MAAGLALLTCGRAQADTTLERAVKATFVTRFGGFVTWPTQGALKLCVQGDPRFAAAVAQAAAGQTMQLRAFSLQPLGAVARDSDCDILYAGGAGQSADDALEAVRGRPVLTVTDSDHGATRGMIHFVVFEGRVRFHIDAAAAARAGLTMDSRLLALALSVKR